MLRHKAHIVTGACLLICFVSSASAQQESGRRVYDEQLRVKFDEQAPATRETGIDGGGWFNFAFFNFDDAGMRRNRTLRQYELRLWGSATIHNVHNFYVRGLVGYDDWNGGDNLTFGDNATNPQLERAWYEYDFAQVLRNEAGQEPPAWFKVRVGRDYATIGTALVLSMPLDMVQIEASAYDLQFMALLGKTRRSTDNIDDSQRVFNHQKRCFWGMQLTYTGLTDHRPFVYILSNKDNTDPDPEDSLQKYSYDSHYVGAGSTGSITPELRYLVELVGEYGKTYSDGVTGDQDNIRAMAFDFLLEYYFPTPKRPKVGVEYLFASGDDDRRASSTATVGGNLAGTADRAFNAFGYRDTGLAFGPEISNLHMWSLNASFFPLEEIEWLKQFEFGSRVFFYHKAKDAGPISDTGATASSQNLGWEWDMYCNWRITSDLSWTLRYGAFQPGAAFDKRDCRQFLLTGVTLSF